MVGRKRKIIPGFVPKGNVNYSSLSESDNDIPPLPKRPGTDPDPILPTQSRQQWVRTGAIPKSFGPSIRTPPTAPTPPTVRTPPTIPTPPMARTPMPTISTKQPTVARSERVNYIRDTHLHYCY